MTANELKYTYMETFSPAKRSEREVLEEAFQSVKDLKAGKITSRPLEDLLNEL